MAPAFSSRYQFLSKRVFLAKMATVFIIEDDENMADCLELALAGCTVHKFTNAITATSALNEILPDLILLDILLDGPDGFSFLNELASYADTAKIPVIVITSLNLSMHDLSPYGVVNILQKESMTPALVCAAAQEAFHAE